jgi:hypothetical protein
MDRFDPPSSANPMLHEFELLHMVLHVACCVLRAVPEPVNADSTFMCAFWNDDEGKPGSSGGSDETCLQASLPPSFACACPCRMLQWCNCATLHVAFGVPG